jgi:CRP-like cAMP-binding protein
LGFISAGGFFGEVPMLDDAPIAEVRERTVTAMTDSRLIYIEKEDIERLKVRYPELQLRMKQCAKVGRQVNKKGKVFKEAAKIHTLFAPKKTGAYGGKRTITAPNLTAHMLPE